MLSASLLIALLALPFDGTLDTVAALRKEGKVEEAITMLRDALATGEGDQRALSLALAEAYVDQFQGLQALEVLGALDTRGDHDAVVLSGRAHRIAADQVYFDNGSQEEIDRHFEDAIQAYERAIDLAGDDTSSAIWYLGNIYLYDDQNKDTALELAQGILDETPDDAYALLLRGASQAFVYFEHVGVEDVEAANAAWQDGVDDLLRADELLPDDVTDALGQLAWFYNAQGMGMKAVDTARAIVERQRVPNLQLLYDLAKKYRDVGGPGGLEASGRALEKMIDVNAERLTQMLRAEEDSTNVSVRLADSIDPFYKRGDRGTCRRILSAIVAADPQHPQTWHNYAVICEETTRYEDALKAYEREIELDPTNPRAYNDLGSVLSNNLRRESDRARELFEKCIALANETVNRLDATEDERANAREAINVAQGNLNTLQPAASSGNLLDSMMEGLRSLNLPKDGEGEEADEGDDGDGPA